MTKIQISKPAELKRLARELLALHPMIIALEGPLGAGKTTLTKAIAQELGIKDMIVSPTFVLSTQYSVLSTQTTLEHIDAWRVEDFSEIERLGLLEMIKNKHLIIIEWADKFEFEIRNLKLENRVVWVKLEYGDKENERRITYEDIGN